MWVRRMEGSYLGQVERERPEAGSSTWSSNKDDGFGGW